MAYCSESDLQARFGAEEIADLLDRDNSGSADTNALASALSDADALIDGYLSSRYTTPLDTVPGLVNAIACNVTRYILWGNNAPDEVRKRYDDAIAQLRDISKGVITLPSTEATQTAEQGGISYNDETTRLFTLDSLSGF